LAGQGGKMKNLLVSFLLLAALCAILFMGCSKGPNPFGNDNDGTMLPTKKVVWWDKNTITEFEADQLPDASLYVLPLENWANNSGLASRLSSRCSLAVFINPTTLPFPPVPPDSLDSLGVTDTTTDYPFQLALRAEMERSHSNWLVNSQPDLTNISCCRYLAEEYASVCRQYPEISKIIVDGVGVATFLAALCDNIGMSKVIIATDYRSQNLQCNGVVIGYNGGLDSNYIGNMDYYLNYEDFGAQSIVMLQDYADTNVIRKTFMFLLMGNGSLCFGKGNYGYMSNYDPSREFGLGEPIDNPRKDGGDFRGSWVRDYYNGTLFLYYWNDFDIGVGR